MQSNYRDKELLSWGTTQSHILTGAGIIEANSKPGKDFQPEELPHNLLYKKIVKQTFQKWLKSDLRSLSIVGAWDRPLFSGGWMESTASDTESYNLQTPSIFIDMRIPKLRPTAQFRARGSLESCTNYELKLLARQHCFSGYSLPSTDNSGNKVFTRHHIIDWNFHPNYPRSRPNKWWVQTKSLSNNSNATESFKEFSVVRDPNNVPVYMERWARRLPTEQQHIKYLALRKVRTCPQILKEQGLPPQKDAVFIVVGQHWCLAVDRSYILLQEYMALLQQEQKQQGSRFVAPNAVGGGPTFVDNLLSDEGSAGNIDANLRRRAAEEYLSLEGSYGILSPDCFTHNATNGVKNGAMNGEKNAFKVRRSTQPWLEGTYLPWYNVSMVFDSSSTSSSTTPYVLHCSPYSSQSAALEDSQQRLLGDWEVLECSFSPAELRSLFACQTAATTMPMRARL